MRKNIYTHAVSSIKAPEGAVEKALACVRKPKKKEKIIHMNQKLKFTGMIAASLAAVVAIGGAVGIFTTTNKSANSFVISANAAEITADNSVKIDLSGGNSFACGEGDGDEISYSIGMPLSVSGDNIETITYAVDRGALSVSYYKDTNPVIDGVIIRDYEDTPVSIDYVAEDKILVEEIEKREGKVAGEDLEAFYALPENQYDPGENYHWEHYSSFTLSYDNQLPEGCSISLVGDGSWLDNADWTYVDSNREQLFNLEGKYSLEEEREVIERLIGQTIHVTVRFTDGSEQTQNIVVGTTVSSYSEVYSEEYNELPDDIKEAKDHKDVFVTLSLA